MKRILFVDDQTIVLEALERMLRSMRGKWEMEFVDSGAKALARLQQAPFDVVVADMSMPVMNGATLLNQVMKLYPKTVRFVLSGYADQQLILKCVGSTHQYLSKPCSAADLKATIERATSLEAGLQNVEIQKLVAQMDNLPSIPVIYTQIIEALQVPETTIEEVGEIIARDIGMTAKILKLVNSAFFGLRREISTPAEAAGYLGLDTIRSLVLSINAFSQFEPVIAKNFSIDALMNHSLQTASVAKSIVRDEGGEQKIMDEAFVAGMLHDTGKLVLAANFPDKYDTVLAQAARDQVTPDVIEHQIFGATHADVGGYLLGLWGLPTLVVEAIALHHTPARSLSRNFSLLTAVHVANVFTHEQSAVPTTVPASQIDRAYLADLGLTDRVDAWRKAWLNNLWEATTL